LGRFYKTRSGIKRTNIKGKEKEAMVVSWTRVVLLVAFIACLGAAVKVEVPQQRAVALVSAVVLLATIYLYKPKPPPAAPERLPKADFTVWVEAGEPFQRIEGMGNDLKSAAGFVRQDVTDMCANLDLLASRLEIMEGKGVGVGGLREATLEVRRRMEVFSREFPEFPGRALEKKDFLLNTLDQCQANLTYVSEKLLEFSRTLPPELSTPISLLQARAGKLAEDFRKARTHLGVLLASIKPPEAVAPAVPLPELKPVEVPPGRPPETEKAEEKPPEAKPEEKPPEGKPEEKPAEERPGVPAPSAPQAQPAPPEEAPGTAPEASG
jgi:hypothetical protein